MPFSWPLLRTNDCWSENLSVSGERDVRQHTLLGKETPHDEATKPVSTDSRSTQPFIEGNTEAVQFWPWHLLGLLPKRSLSLRSPGFTRLELCGRTLPRRWSNQAKHGCARTVIMVATECLANVKFLYL